MEKSVQQMQEATNRLLEATPELAQPDRGSRHTTKKDTLIQPPETKRDKKSARSSYDEAGGAPSGGGGGGGPSSAMAELRRRNQELADQVKELEQQLKYRTSTYIEQEARFKEQIGLLEKQLQHRTDDDYHKRMQSIRGLHEDTLHGLELIQGNTARILQDQEKDLMRAFRARIQDLNKELKTKENMKGDYSAELQARHRRVLHELHAAQELAQIFDKKNRSLQGDNQRLQERLRTREDDRQAVMKELVAARRENKRLNNEVEELTDARLREQKAGSQMEATASSAPQRDGQEGMKPPHGIDYNANRIYERDLQRREEVQRLRRALEAERRANAGLQRQLNNFLASRSECEILLRGALDDVKHEIRRRRAAAAQEGDRRTPVPPTEEVPVQEFSVADRERVIELLLSQERVVQCLYERTFPDVQQTTPPAD